MVTATYPQTVSEALQDVRTASLDQLLALLRFLPWHKVPYLWLNTLTISRRITSYRLLLLGYYASRGSQVPRRFQIEAALESYEDHGSLVIAGTGSGKTLIIAPLILLNGSLDALTLTISPLKRLQITQVATFCTHYGIDTIAINDDTPHNDNYWNMMVHNLTTCTAGTARHLIITTEQLFKSKTGHLSRLCCLLYDTRFQKRIDRVNVDEVHFIYFAGTEHYGLDAFHPAWGCLKEIKAFFHREFLGRDLWQLVLPMSSM
ncbi:hypothetical protein ARMGADRAFT_1030937 [Armillaria gallica]|uniref:DEAD/DEAH-box helicase domain-containing protein n=1 Tax=Armillaria gallica TaxID=47427 RepID=A0A2H3DWN9_ARMGA|nr:hypothetical protein ARMGADRAFT_1030937 [Armillaria gallica]